MPAWSAPCRSPSCPADPARSFAGSPQAYPCSRVIKNTHSTEIKAWLTICVDAPTGAPGNGGEEGGGRGRGRRRRTRTRKRRRRRRRRLRRRRRRRWRGRGGGGGGAGGGGGGEGGGEGGEGVEGGGCKGGGEGGGGGGEGGGGGGGGGDKGGKGVLTPPYLHVRHLQHHPPLRLDHLLIHVVRAHVLDLRARRALHRLKRGSIQQSTQIG